MDTDYPGILEGDGSREFPFVLTQTSSSNSTRIQREIVERIFGPGTYPNPYAPERAGAVAMLAKASLCIDAGGKRYGRAYYESARGLPGNKDLCETILEIQGEEHTIWFDLYKVTAFENDPNLKKAREGLKETLAEHPATPRVQEEMREGIGLPRRQQSKNYGQKGLEQRIQRFKSIAAYLTVFVVISILFTMAAACFESPITISIGAVIGLALFAGTFVCRYVVDSTSRELANTTRLAPEPREPFQLGSPCRPIGSREVPQSNWKPGSCMADGFCSKFLKWDPVEASCLLPDDKVILQAGLGAFGNEEEIGVERKGKIVAVHRRAWPITLINPTRAPSNLTATKADWDRASGLGALRTILEEQNPNRRTTTDSSETARDWPSMSDARAAHGVETGAETQVGPLGRDRDRSRKSGNTPSSVKSPQSRADAPTCKMQRKQSRNLGERTIEWLYRDQLRVDEEWSIVTHTGFTWWADRNAQHVEIVGVESDKELGEAFLVRVTTDFIQGISLNEKTLQGINLMLMAHASMSGPVLDKESSALRLSAVLRVHEGNVESMRLLLSLASVLQIAEARIMAPEVARIIGAQPAESGHPQNGTRNEPDELAEVVAQAIAPLGRQPSRWDGQELARVAAEPPQRFPGINARSSKTSLAVAVPSNGSMNICDFHANQAHPRYGNGLFALQTFPLMGYSEDAGVRLALALNGGELAGCPAGYGLGSYCFREGKLHFLTFLPNAAYQTGLLFNLCMAFAERAVGFQGRLAASIGLDTASHGSVFRPLDSSGTLGL